MNVYETHLCAAFTPALEYLFLLTELFDLLDKNEITSALGRNAKFERNRAACDEGIYHIHFCFPSEITEKWLRKDPFHRTSDNFVIYVRHWRFDKLCCILAVITPEAHQRIDHLLPQLIVKAQHFNQLGREELAELNWLI